MLFVDFVSIYFILHDDVFFDHLSSVDLVPQLSVFVFFLNNGKVIIGRV